MCPISDVQSRLRLFKPTRTSGGGSSAATDWVITIQDSLGNVLHTFQPGSDGIASGTAWKAGLDVTVDVTSSSLGGPFNVVSDGNRRLWAVISSTTGVDADTGGVVACEIEG